MKTKKEKEINAQKKNEKKINAQLPRNKKMVDYQNENHERRTAAADGERRTADGGRRRRGMGGEGGARWRTRTSIYGDSLLPTLGLGGWLRLAGGRVGGWHLDWWEVVALGLRGWGSGGWGR